MYWNSEVSEKTHSSTILNIFRAIIWTLYELDPDIQCLLIERVLFYFIFFVWNMGIRINLSMVSYG